MPVFDIIWYAQSPSNQIDWIVESENSGLIFDIVLTKQMEYLFGF